MSRPEYSRSTDAELLRATRRDPKAFGVVYERHIDILLGHLTRETRSRDVALELAAETFARALERSHRFRPPPDGNARPWLFGIAGNLLRSYHRRSVVEARARRRLGILDETTFTRGPDATIEDIITSGQDGERVQAAIAGLPAEQRLAIQLRICRDLPYEEIANRLRCTPGAARTRVSRGLAALRIELRKDT